jgi:hypothetical protein
LQATNYYLFNLAVADMLTLTLGKLHAATCSDLDICIKCAKNSTVIKAECKVWVNFLEMWRKHAHENWKVLQREIGGNLRR